MDTPGKIPEVNFKQMEGPTPLIQDLLWPFRKYGEVREFVSREGPASVIIGLTGIMLTNLGISPGIAAAVGILGFSTTLTKFVLMAVLNTEEPFKQLGLTGKGVTTIIFFIVGYGLFLLYGPGDLQNLAASTIQFILGIFVTYLAGFTFMRTYSYMEEAGASVTAKILLPSTITLGMIISSVFLIPEILNALGGETAAEVFQEKPANVDL
jgi:hypothetical protein